VTLRETNGSTAEAISVAVAAPKASVRLAVGDVVVYGSHGAGPVTARESKLILGTQQEVIELELSGGLRVELPLERAHELLRPLATESDLDRVQEVLRADQAVNGGTWLKRKKESLARLNDGDPIGLARIVRDGTRRDPARTPDGAKAPSLWERELARRARGLLSTEIAFAREIEPEEADSWIERQLGQCA
jgi:RNA polymerase-interacting CarD/CdnL/TRCF family regulator